MGGKHFYVPLNRVGYVVSYTMHKYFENGASISGVSRDGNTVIDVALE